jgi:hypothetical protein
MRIALIGVLWVLGISTCFGDEKREEVVALVDLQFLKVTDVTASVLCLTDKEEDCFVYGTHYLWRARVRKVISGDLREKSFLVLYGRHALLEKNIRGMTAVLRRLEPDAPFGAHYQVVGVGVPQKLLCFDRPVPGKNVQTLRQADADPSYCLNPDGE